MHVDVDATPGPGFGLEEELGPFVSEWHTHARHQVLFASAGSMELRASGRRWLLPPRRAAFVPAGTRHRVSSARGIALRTVYLAPELVVATLRDAVVFGVTPLAREMLLYAMRWPARATGADETRDAFFATIARLLPEWHTGALALSVPSPASPELERAMRFTEDNLAAATIEAAARAAHVSVRTLARRFSEETGEGFRDYLATARMIRAMELLDAPGASVTRVAFDVGFASPGAFSTAFRARVGESPSDYRARSRAG